MLPEHQYLAWQYTSMGIGLQTADRSVVVPSWVSEALVGPAGIGLAGDPAEDLLRLEGFFRLDAARLHKVMTGRDVEQAGIHADLAAISDRRGLRARRQRHQLHEILQRTSANHEAATNAVADAYRRLHGLRQIIIALDVPDGPLRDAQVGWRRNPSRPPFVSVFTSEDFFLFSNPRRAATADWGGQVIAADKADKFGSRWRRDGEDDDPDATGVSFYGPWQIGYIPAAGEVYATRQCSYLDAEVWLLGNGLPDSPRIRRQLADLETHMHEPNSLILAAETVHATARSEPGEPATWPTTATNIRSHTTDEPPAEGSTAIAERGYMNQPGGCCDRTRGGAT